jgi:hypothetical protein
MASANFELRSLTTSLLVVVSYTLLRFGETHDPYASQKAHSSRKSIRNHQGKSTPTFDGELGNRTTYRLQLLLILERMMMVKV